MHNRPKQLFFKLALPIRRAYWFLFRPTTHGVKVVICHEDKILFIRNSYGKKYWTFPGGGVERGEAFDVAGKREVQEEVGIRLDAVTYLGEYSSNFEYKNDIVHCYAGDTQGLDLQIDESEVGEAKWCRFDTPPEPLSPSVKKILNLYFATISKK